MLAVSFEDQVGTLTLARPEKRNALSIELREAIASALGKLVQGGARCTVLTGAPPAFCAGMDVTQFGGPPEQRMRLLAATEAWVGSLVEHPVPLIAAVNGAALGGGFAMALLADVRIAAESARFGFPEIKRGIPPSLGAALSSLPPGVARELCVTGREIDAVEALRLGVVSEVVPDAELVQCAHDRACAIAALPDRGVRQILDWTRRGDGEAWRLQLERESEVFRRVVLGP